MAEKGYLLVKEKEADAKRAELARVAELKKQQEAAALAPAPKPTRPRCRPRCLARQDTLTPRADSHFTVKGTGTILRGRD